MNEILEKALDKVGLVQKDVQVHKNGKTFTQKRWVRADETAETPEEKRNREIENYKTLQAQAESAEEPQSIEEMDVKSLKKRLSEIETEYNKKQVEISKVKINNVYKFSSLNKQLNSMSNKMTEIRKRIAEIEEGPVKQLKAPEKPTSEEYRKIREEIYNLNRKKAEENKKIEKYKNELKKDPYSETAKINLKMAKDSIEDANFRIKKFDRRLPDNEKINQDEVDKILGVKAEPVKTETSDKPKEPVKAKVETSKISIPSEEEFNKLPVNTEIVFTSSEDKLKYKHKKVGDDKWEISVDRDGKGFDKLNTPDNPDYAYNSLTSIGKTYDWDKVDISEGKVNTQEEKQDNTAKEEPKAEEKKVEGYSLNTFNDLAGKDRESAIKYLKDNGITWKENDHEGINWMRAKMAANKTGNAGTDKTTASSVKPSDSSKKPVTPKQSNTPKPTSTGNSWVDSLKQQYDNDKGKIIEAIKAAGVSWKENENTGINFMRAVMAAKKHNPK